MEEIRALYCMSPGVPTVSGKAWLPAVRRPVVIFDPFLRKPRTAVAPVPGEDVGLGSKANVYLRVELRTNALWLPWIKVLKRYSAGLHDGMLYQLWNVIVGKDHGLPPWGPSWITADGQAQLLEFPAAVTRSIAAFDQEAVDRTVKQWVEGGYLSSAVESKDSALGKTIIDILMPMARLAVQKEALLVAEASGYIEP